MRFSQTSWLEQLIAPHFLPTTKPRASISWSPRSSLSVVLRSPLVSQQRNVSLSQFSNYLSLYLWSLARYVCVWVCVCCCGWYIEPLLTLISNVKGVFDFSLPRRSLSGKKRLCYDFLCLHDALRYRILRRFIATILKWDFIRVGNTNLGKLLLPKNKII